MDLPPRDKLRPLMERLAALFASMDEVYARAAAHYGLSCEGCDENCCTQRFFHYTLIEYLYLMEGVRALGVGRRAEALARAKEVTGTYGAELREGRLRPLMCPLNFGGLCAAYAHRPMICRAHGLPHKFRRPDGETVEGGGCRRLGEAAPADLRIDRTDFYAELASIEKELREMSGFSGRYRRTTAQMLMDMAGGLE